MLGFKVSEATVSRYMPPRSRRLGPSWRTFLRNQAMAFGHCEYAEERSDEDAGLQGHSYAPQLQRSAATQIATLRVGLRRVLLPCPTGQGERYVIISEPCFRSEVHRVKLKRHPSCGHWRLKTLELARRAVRDSSSPFHRRAEIYRAETSN